MKNTNIINYIKSLSGNEKVHELLITTINNIILKQDNLENFIKENENKIIHIRDWIFSIVENNEQWKTPRVLTIDALNNAADKYFEKKNNKIKTIELDEKHEKLIANLGDYYIVQMLTPQALDNESKIMQHCIGYGNYDENLKNAEYEYLSLRDKYNKSHVTIEVRNKNIKQLQGKQNKIPEDKYLNILIPWLMKNDYNLTLKNYDLVLNKNDNNMYSIYELPDNCKIDGDLYFRFKHISKLPDNLVVNGDLDFYGNKFLLSLPNGLVVNGDLDLSFCRIKNIPEDIQVKGNLILHSSHIESLPNNLVVNGNLGLNYTNIKKLPDNLIIKGSLELNHSAIIELPDNLIVEGSLELKDCYDIEYLPKGLTVNGSLSMQRSNIIRISDNTKIMNDMYMNNSKIKYLPDNLVVGGNFDMSNTFIENMPNNLFVGKNLYLIKTGIKEINENISMGSLSLKDSLTEKIVNKVIVDKLDISFSKLKYIPDYSECVTIYIDETQIDLIKDNIEYEYIAINSKDRQNKDINYYKKNEFLEKFKNKRRINSF